jgi:uncharacterized membrane protein (DUF485 family)
MKMTKKNVLMASSIYVLYFILLLLISIPCQSAWCHVREDSMSVRALYALLPLALSFILSLITYKMREEIFRAWWNFARWMVPVIVLVTMIIQLMPSNNGFFNLDSLVYVFVLAPLYVILILVSLVKIMRAYGKK